MDPAHQHIVDAALKLPLAARGALAAISIESLDGPPDRGAEEAWRIEIERRMRETDEGLVMSIPWEEAERIIFDDKPPAGH